MEVFENLSKWESYFNPHNPIPKSEHLATWMCMWSAVRNVSEGHCEVQLSVGWVVARGGKPVTARSNTVFVPLQAEVRIL